MPADNRLLGILKDIMTSWENASSSNYPEKKNWIKSALKNLFILHTEWYVEKLPMEVPEWEKWLLESSGAMKRSFNSVISYVNATIQGHEIQWLSEDWHSWRALCTLRSEIAFLIDTYQPYLNEEDMVEFELNGFDNQLRDLQNGGTIPEDFVPAGVPATHWWWYPK